jgi:hypothetical protein
VSTQLNLASLARAVVPNDALSPALAPARGLGLLCDQPLSPAFAPPLHVQPLFFCARRHLPLPRGSSWREIKEKRKNRRRFALLQGKARCTGGWPFPCTGTPRWWRRTRASRTRCFSSTRGHRSSRSAPGRPVLAPYSRTPPSLWAILPRARHARWPHGLMYGLMSHTEAIQSPYMSPYIWALCAQREAAAAVRA